MNNESQNKFVPMYFDPGSLFTEQNGLPAILSGQNFWVRFSRDNRKTYAEAFTGNKYIEEDYDPSSYILTGTVDLSSGDPVVLGSGTDFEAELHPGMMLAFIDGTVIRLIGTVESVESTTSFTMTAPSDDTYATLQVYPLPVGYPVGTRRGVSVRGKVVQFPSGHLIGVGTGDLALNGSTTLGSSGSLALSDLPQFALYEPSTDTYTQDDVGISPPTSPITLSAVSRIAITNATNVSPIAITTGTAHGLTTGDRVPIGGILGNTAANGEWIITVTGASTFTLNGSTGNGAYVSGGYVFPSVMRAGSYNIRVCSLNTTTNGFSQPTDVIEPIALTVNQSIKVTFNSAMHSDQNAYALYGTAFEDNSTATIEARYMGPWYMVAEREATEMIDGTHTAGTEAGAYTYLSYSDSEITLATNLISFDNFEPKKASFVDLLNGIPIYFSCLGKGDSANKSKNPGPAAIPSKPSNPEAVFLSKTFTTAGGEVILGEYNAKSRLFVLCENSLQQIILTTVDAEPIAFRSLWASGFRNPYNLTFFKEYLYAFTTNGIIRSVAGGDDLSTELEFSMDVMPHVKNWECGKVVTGYCPKNKAICFMYPVKDTVTGYWYTECLPFIPDKGIWNPPIRLQNTGQMQDFIVTSTITIGSSMYLVVSGFDDKGNFNCKTFEFDGGDNTDKEAYLVWSFINNSTSSTLKRVKQVEVIDAFNGTGTLEFHGAGPSNDFPTIESIKAGTASVASQSVVGSSGNVKVVNELGTNIDPYPFITMGIRYQYTTTFPEFHSIEIISEVNNSRF